MVKVNKLGRRKMGFRRISDEALQAKTIKGWAGWLEILDSWSASSKGHTLTAKHLREVYSLSPWWAQAVTIRYEWEKGLRK